MSVAIAEPTAGTLQIAGAVVLCTLDAGVVTPFVPGTAAYLDVGTTAGTAMAGNDARLIATPSFLAALANGAFPSIAATTWTKLLPTDEQYDVGGYWASSRWTPPAGKYIIGASIPCDGVSGGNWRLAVYKNGSAHRYIAGGFEMQQLCGAAVVQANGTDYFEFFVYLSTSSGFIYGDAAQGGAFWGYAIPPAA